MSSEVIVVLVIVLLAIAGVIFLERNSRRNARTEKQEKGD
jgi:hypothetical protein